RGAADRAILLEVDLVVAADDHAGLEQGEAARAGRRGRLEDVIARRASGDATAREELGDVGVGVVGDSLLGLSAIRTELQREHLTVTQNDPRLHAGAAGAAARRFVQEEGMRPVWASMRRSTRRALHRASSVRAPALNQTVESERDLQRRRRRDRRD